MASSPLDEDRGRWSEGRDGDHATYVERLRPPIVVVILGLSLAGVLGVAYAAAYGAIAGWVAGTALGLVCLVILGSTIATLRVDNRVVRAGRARLPLEYVGHAVPLDAEAMRAARRHGDPRDYLVLRAWSSRTGVAVTVSDPRDPHPRWIVTSRDPERFAAAIEEARSALIGPAQGE